MFSTRRTRGGGAAVGLALTLCAVPAAADDARVRILPARGAALAATDRLMPASTQFNIEVRLADLLVSASSEATGRIKIWPKAVLDCEKEPDKLPSDGAKQYHKLGMSLTGQGTDRALSAAVPPLQVGEPFCFQVEVYASISDVQLAQASQAASKALSKKLLAAPDCLTALNAGDFATALEDAIKATLPKSITPAALAALSHDIQDAANYAYQAFQIDGANACRGAQTILVKLTAMNAAQAQGLEAAQKAARDALAGKPAPAGLTEPFVASGSTVSLAGQLTDGKKTPAALIDAAAQLEARAARGNATYRAWATVLRQLGEALGKAGNDAGAQKKAIDKATAAAKALRKTTSLPLEIWTGKAFVPIAEVQANPARFHMGQVLPQLDLLEEPGAVPAGQQAVAKALIDAFKQYGETTTNYEEATAAIASDTVLRNAAMLTLDDALRKALTRDDVRQRINLAVSNLQLSGLAGKGQTPNSANYFNADIGVVTALPSGGESGTVWVMPYAGITAYFTAVDRTVPLSQLTGEYGRAFRQRVSLTMGMTLSNPSLPGRTLKQPLGFGNYPLLAVGVRLTEFGRLTGGAVFYQIADPNPASAGAKLHAAPFVGVSLDADIVHALTNKF